MPKLTDLQRIDHTRNLLNEAEKIMVKLDEIAIRDRYLSNDEVELLNTVNRTIVSYKKIAEQALEDQEVTQDEFEEMKRFEKIITDEAMHQALLDGEMTKDEKQLLGTLFAALTKINTFK